MGVLSIVTCWLGIGVLVYADNTRFQWQDGLRSRLPPKIAARLPRNFSTTPLPDLLTSLNGTDVRSYGPTSDVWVDRKDEIRHLLEQSYYGSFPSVPPPAIARWSVLNSTVTRGFTDEWYSVTFSTPGEPTTLEVEAMWPPAAVCGAPDSQSSPPCPVFMTQTNHRRWSIIAAARGYLAITYPGSDNNCADGPHCEEGDPTAGFKRVDPGATFQLIARRAYLAARVVDLLYEFDRQGQNAPGSRRLNTSRIGITGHSRNGKQSLIAAAWDERIAAVADSSSGVPGFNSYRFSSGNTFSETPSSFWPGPWWLPSLKGMAGFEDTNPIDAHGLLALIAPRPVLHANAWTDNGDPSFGIETTYLSGLDVYDFVGGSGAGGRGNLRLDHRPGAHHGWETPHRYVDWFDWHFDYHPFGLPGYTYDARWPEASNLLHRGYSWEGWAERQQGPPALPGKQSSRIDRFQWLWGNAPGAATGTPWSPGGVYDSFPYIDVMLGHDELKLDQEQAELGGDGSVRGEAGGQSRAESAPLRGIIAQNQNRTGRGQSSAAPVEPQSSLQRTNVNIGAYVKGDMYYDIGGEEGMRLDAAGKGRPGVVFLHPLSYQRGFVEGYPHQPTSIIESLAEQAGAVVVTYDQLGFSMRQHEGRDFYDRYASWSRLGRMAWDARSAVDLLVANTSDGAFRPAGRVDRLPDFPAVDPERIYIVGYSAGGMAGLVAGALDGRVRGVAAIASIEPMRAGGANAVTGGNQRWYDWHGLVPRLGYFGGAGEGKPHDVSELPADWDDGLALLGCGPGDGQYPVVPDRRALVVAPVYDRYHRVEMVKGLVEQARSMCKGARGDAGWLNVSAPAVVNELSVELTDPAVNFVRGA